MENGDAGARIADRAAQLFEIGRLRNVDGHIVKSFEKAVGDPLAVKAVGQMFVERFIGALAKARIVELGPRSTDNSKIGWKQPVRIQSVKRRKKHSPCKVARGAEHQ